MSRAATSYGQRRNVGHRLAAVVAVVAVSFVAGAARAYDLKIPNSDASIRTGLTQSLSTLYHSDRNALSGDETDTFTEFRNRTNIVLMHGSTTFSMRIDGAWFAGADKPPTQPSGTDANANRTVLEKISLSSVQRVFDITAGDFYMRLGRVALDMTKRDEAANDTSIRGGRATLRLGPVEGTAFGGFVNPLDVDDATGYARRLPSDVIGGGRLKLRTKHIRFAGHYAGAGVQSIDTDERSTTHILGGTITVPSILDAVSLFGEVDYMSKVTKEGTEPGLAAYFSATANFGPVAILTEAIYLRNFQLENDFNKFGTESHNTYTYTRAPTLTHNKQDIINGYNKLGGRGRVDVRVSRDFSFFGNYGYFVRSSALHNEAFMDSGIPVHDFFAGASIGGFPMHAHFDIAGGYRVDTVVQTEPKSVDFSHGFFDFEVSFEPIKGHTLEVQAQLRDIRKAGAEYADFFITTSYRPSKYISGGFTYEYTTEYTNKFTSPGQSPRKHGGVNLTGNFTETIYARAFGGTTRGGLRCVDGFCRVYPPFLGFKAEVVAQF